MHFLDFYRTRHEVIIYEIDKWITEMATSRSTVLYGQGGGAGRVETAVAATKQKINA